MERSGNEGTIRVSLSEDAERAGRKYIQRLSLVKIRFSLLPMLMFQV